MDSGLDLYIRFEADASPEYYQVVACCRALARERTDVIHVETGAWPETIHHLRFADPLLARRVWNRLDGGESVVLRMDGQPADNDTLSRATAPFWETPLLLWIIGGGLLALLAGWFFL